MTKSASITRKVLLATPRGFCAGVDRAVRTVEKALELHGAPVYVRKQIVHNTSVVHMLEGRGAVFVEDLDEVPPGAVVVFSAHGVAPSVHQEAAERVLRTIDATCPLVTKVHTEAKRFAAQDYDILLIGERSHDEIIGTLGEAPDHIQVVDGPDDAANVQVRDPRKVAWLSQTTLTVEETTTSIALLRERFPHLEGPPREDICYAAQNRQSAVKAIAPRADLVLVVGSSNSHNSTRLVHTALSAGAPAAYLIDHVEQIREDWITEATATVGLTAGASAPESTVRAVLGWLADHGYRQVEEVVTAREEQLFSLPLELRS